ncbi:MAG TPA: hypothetical protein VH062_01935 [Polyangiaceae bacterium]|nr:hypothetical protein [Polyangiaceae bacterium]
MNAQWFEVTTVLGKTFRVLVVNERVAATTCPEEADVGSLWADECRDFDLAGWTVRQLPRDRS